MFRMLSSSNYDCVAVDISGVEYNVYRVQHASGRASIVINKQFAHGIVHDTHPVAFDHGNIFNWTDVDSWVAVGKCGRVPLRVNKVVETFGTIPIIYLVKA